MSAVKVNVLDLRKERSKMSGKLPKLSQAKIMSPEDVKRCWKQGWDMYLKKRKEWGLDDPKNLPTHEDMHKRCTI